MTESRLAAILAEETPPFWRRPVAPLRRRRRPVMSFIRRSLVRVVYLTPLLALGWWVLTSAEFAVADVEIEGAERVARSWVEQQLIGVHGQNLVLLRIDGVRQALLAHPFVEAVQVRKDLPDRLIVEIEEHQPAAVLVPLVMRSREESAEERIGKGSVTESGFLVTQEGLVFSRAGTRDDSGLLRLVVEDEALTRRIESSGDALIGTTLDVVRTALDMREDLSDIGQRWGTGLHEVRILGRDDFELRFERSPGSVLIASRSARAKAILLDNLLPQIARRYSVDSFDLRFGNRIVLRGATDLLEARQGSSQNEGIGSEGVGIERVGSEGA